MRVERVNRWTWMIVGLLAGFLIGSVRNLFDEDAVTGYPNSMNGQQQFEMAMLTHKRVSPTDVRPLFYKLVVRNIKDPNPELRGPDETQKILTPEQKKKFDAIKKPSDQTAFLREIAQDEANRRRTFAIAGVFHNERPVQRNGVWQNEWVPYFWIAPTPYKPTRQYAVTGTVPPVAPKMTDKLRGLAEKLHLKDPDPPSSVLDYLSALRAQGKIDFTYEWWKTPRITVVSWMAVSFVLIGIIWPTVVNLLAFGTFSRPYEEKADLSKVRSTSDKKAAQGPTEADLEQLRALEAQLEADLAASGHGGPIAPADQPAPAPVKVLTAKELEVAAAAAKAEEERAFAAKADDFYPTEKRIKHKDEH